MGFWILIGQMVIAFQFTLKVQYVRVGSWMPLSLLPLLPFQVCVKVYGSHQVQYFPLLTFKLFLLFLC